MLDKKIVVRINKQDKVDWKNLEPLQNEKLKRITEKNFNKLKQSMIDNGFVDALKVWDDGKKLWMLDGKHRKMALLDLENQGYEVPQFLSAQFIDCNNRKEAAELVLVFSSSYADIDESGLIEYINIESLDPDQLGLRIEIPTIEFELLKDAEINLSLDLSGVHFESDRIVRTSETIKCPKCGFDLGIAKRKSGKEDYKDENN
jgi:hypothetical protein